MKNGPSLSRLHFLNDGVRERLKEKMRKCCCRDRLSCVIFHRRRRDTSAGEDGNEEEETGVKEIKKR
jgi:hypothetical protein